MCPIREWRGSLDLRRRGGPPEKNENPGELPRGGSVVSGVQERRDWSLTSKPSATVVSMAARRHATPGESGSNPTGRSIEAGKTTEVTRAPTPRVEVRILPGLPTSCREVVPGQNLSHSLDRAEYQRSCPGTVSRILALAGQNPRLSTGPVRVRLPSSAPLRNEQDRLRTYHRYPTPKNQTSSFWLGLSLSVMPFPDPSERCLRW